MRASVWVLVVGGTLAACVAAPKEAAACVKDGMPVSGTRVQFPHYKILYPQYRLRA